MMILMPVDELKPGMRLARPVFDARGRVLVAPGVRLRPGMIRRLELSGYSHVYVSDELFEDVEVPEVVGGAVRKHVSLVLRRVMPGLAARSRRMIALIDECVEILIEEVVSARKDVIALFDIRSSMDHTFSHSVGVAILTLVLAKILRSPTREELAQVGKGAILHDVGKMRVPDSILSKPSRLTDLEFEVVKGHTVEGYRILSDILGRDSLPARMALEHHERWDGSGYPRGLKREETLFYARLCGICDVYDAMTTDRPYKGPVHPCEALRVIREDSGRLYDPKIVDSLLRVVAPYPPGTLVKLNTGEIAVVMKLNDDFARPVVKIIKNHRCEFCRSFREVDLLKSGELEVSRPVSWHEVMTPVPWRRLRRPSDRTRDR